MAQVCWETVKSIKQDGKGFSIDVTEPLKRAKVPGGWLVRYIFHAGLGMTFVPDPGHAWE